MPHTPEEFDETVPGHLDEIKREVKTLSRAFQNIPVDLHRRMTAVELSVDQRREVMRDTIREAVQDAMPRALLTDEQHRWVTMAIEKEAQSIKFRKAVIEKTLTALIWSALAGAAYILKQYLASIGIKL